MARATALKESAPPRPRSERHRSEQSPLYRSIDLHYPEFLACMAEPGRPLPLHIKKEFDELLKCGRLEHGFLSVQCGTCHKERRVAFSCTNRWRFRRTTWITPGTLPFALRARPRRFKIAPSDFVCPGCGARHMAESAALLVDGDIAQANTNDAGITLTLDKPQVS